MRKLARSVAFVAIAGALALAACIETKNTATVNPDGSAKVTLDALLSAAPGPMGAMGGGPSQGAPEEKAKKQANDFLAKAQGVDAWRDVSFEVAKDGRTHVKATAYVPDLGKFRLDMIPPVKWTTDGKGNCELNLVNDKATSAPASRPSLSDEEIAKKVATERQNYQQMKPIMQMMLGSLKIDATYELPGTITEANVFTKTSANTVKIVFEGKKFIEAMDKIMGDEALFTKMLKEGRDLEHDQDFMIESMFGKKGPAIAKVATATKPQFDYKADMAAAKAAQPEMLKKLGIDLKAAPMRMPPKGPAPADDTMNGGGQ